MILDKILAKKFKEIEDQKQINSIDAYLKKIEKNNLPSYSFKQALSNSSSGIIAEFKRNSPSKGAIFPNAKVEEIVPMYARHASAISILTDTDFFGGSMMDLEQARTLARLPLLRKDFMIDPFQIYQAKALGADIILLIAAALDKKTCNVLAKTAHTLNMEVLLEIHTEKELEYINSEIDVVGINNRNLHTFKTDIQTSFILGTKIPTEFIKISESGISSPDMVKELKAVGFKGFLMGENFMKTSQPGETLAEFVKALNEK